MEVRGRVAGVIGVPIADFSVSTIFLFNDAPQGKEIRMRYVGRVTTVYNVFSFSCC
jgi:hypothetical protein